MLSANAALRKLRDSDPEFYPLDTFINSTVPAILKAITKELSDIVKTVASRSASKLPHGISCPHTHVIGHMMAGSWDERADFQANLEQEPVYSKAGRCYIICSHGSLQRKTKPRFKSCAWDLEIAPGRDNSAFFRDHKRYNYLRFNLSVTVASIPDNVSVLDWVRAAFEKREARVKRRVALPAPSDPPTPPGPTTPRRRSPRSMKKLREEIEGLPRSSPSPDTSPIVRAPRQPAPFPLEEDFFAASPAHTAETKLSGSSDSSPKASSSKDTLDSSDFEILSHTIDYTWKRPPSVELSNTTPLKRKRSFSNTSAGASKRKRVAGRLADFKGKSKAVEDPIVISSDDIPGSPEV